LGGGRAGFGGFLSGGLYWYSPDWYRLVALFSAAIGLLFLTGAGRILRDSTHILMEGTPRGLNLADVAATIRNVKGVRDVHHLNIWTVCSHILALSVHIDSEAEFEGARAAVMHEIEHLLADRFHITHTTIQMDCSTCVNGPVIRELSHMPRSSCGHDH